MTRDYVVAALTLSILSLVLTIVFTNIQTGFVLAFGLVLGTFIGMQMMVRYRDRFEQIVRGSVLH